MRRLVGLSRQRLYTFVFALLLAAGSVLAPWSVSPAVAADATLVFFAADILKEQHFAAPDGLRLLGVAAEGVRGALTAAGITHTLAPLAATSEAAAREEFQRLFDRAVTLAQGRLTGTQLQHAAARAMAASMDDSHTAFLAPEIWAELLRELQNQASFTGVGMRILPRDGRFYIRDVFPGAPAARAGLQALDRITAIDGQSTEGLTTISGRIRGAAGTTVAITIQRPGQTEPQTFTITREPILVPPVDYRMLDGRIGYIHLFHLSEGSSVAFRQALADLLQQGMRALLLDLRGNSGGLVGETVASASALLPARLPVMVRESRQRKTTDVTFGGPVIPAGMPLVAMTDEGTASGGEVISAAIQEHLRGTLVGVRTAGALLASQYFPLPGGAAIEVSVSRVTTGKGVVVEGQGVTPEVEVQLTTEDIDRGVDTQMQRALQTLMQRVLSPALAPAA